MLWYSNISVFTSAILNSDKTARQIFFGSGTVEKLTPENMGVDTKIMFLSGRIVEIEGVATRSLRYKIRSALRGLKYVRVKYDVNYTSRIAPSLPLFTLQNSFRSPRVKSDFDQIFLYLLRTKKSTFKYFTSSR